MTLEGGNAKLTSNTLHAGKWSCLGPNFASANAPEYELVTTV